MFLFSRLRYMTCVRKFYYTKMTIPSYLMNRVKPPAEILANLEPGDAERLELLKLKHGQLLEMGHNVPSNPTDMYFLELLCCPSISQQLKVNMFYFKKEKRRENDVVKKQSKVAYVKDPNEPSVTANRIIRLIDKRTIDRHNLFRVFSEMRCQYSQKIVFDFSFENYMRLMDQKNLASQISACYELNLAMKPYPFHLHLCGLHPYSNQHAYLCKTSGLNYETCPLRKLEELAWTVTPDPYYQVFPVDNPDRPVIYLTPNASTEFSPGEWDHSAVFVIGALVDKVSKPRISYQKARSVGVECRRLPLERYVRWNGGRSKSLTLNCIYSILMTAKETDGNWKEAILRNLPRRFLYGNESLPYD